MRLLTMVLLQHVIVAEPETKKTGRDASHSVVQDVPTTVDWAAFLSRHDPIWPLGAYKHCTNVSHYDLFHGQCGESQETNNGGRWNGPVSALLF